MALNEFLIERNNYLSRNIKGYYRYEHYGYYDDRTPKYINHLKNDFNKESTYTLNKAKNDLINNLADEIIEICNKIDAPGAICVVPRSKTRDYFYPSQLIFLETIREIIYEFDNLEEIDGTDYIIRHTNTRKTHLDKKGYGGDGDTPYPGIAKETCYFSPQIRGKNILLIDDIYTKTINIIEDMAQALFDHGAKSVTVFAIGYTMPKYS